MKTKLVYRLGRDVRMICWDDQLDAIIRKNWGKISTANIAKKIGPPCTRNAVIGRANRIGLPIIGWPKKPNQEAPHVKSIH